MSRKLFSPWGGLPDFCALAAIVWCLSHGLTMGMVGAHIGRQSSTFAIGIGMSILAAPIMGAAGLVVGRIVAFALGSFVPQRWVPVLKWSAPVVLVVIGVLASRHASAPLYAAEREARPRVIQNSAQIRKQAGSRPVEGITRGALVYDHLKNVNRAIPWGTGAAQLTNHGDELEIGFSPQGDPLRIPLTGIDYITLVYAKPLRLGVGARPALALLITGRATGRRDLLAVISESRELVYLELLDRFWNPGFWNATAVAIAPAAAGDLILVGSEPQHLLVFSPPDPA